MNHFKHYISNETGSVYRLRDDRLWYIPVNADGTYTEADGWTMVEEDLMASEPLGDPQYFADHPEKQWRTMGDVFADARKALA